MFASFLEAITIGIMKSAVFHILAFCALSISLSSCGGGQSSTESSNKQIADLPFQSAETAKEYADIVLKSIRTNREKPLHDQFQTGTAVNLVKLKRLIGMYSTGIGGREWEFHDFHDLSGSSDQSQGFDYAWLDLKGRLGIQIYILPKHDGEKYYIDQLDFQSRLDVMDSVTFPSGDDIAEYKKINYDWDKK